ncbi:hypothetical protein SCHPADRAFT_936315 [Schizopora paradoxa]|uniref:Uncharacterized protein n=1 Tax=Schizopora paradoxa TaxID=27342 RepID=A0A0H2S2W5_9AGAM|nr:hypothetical protein SCHPADRAFT_936315 [Schizopora paradoxa]
MANEKWSEIWDEVSVGVLAPKSRFMPIGLLGFVSLFFDYLATLSLSLYLFNLFCLPLLDGSHFFSALLDFIGGAREFREARSPIELNGESDLWLDQNIEHPYSLEDDLESGSTELTSRLLSSSPRRAKTPHFAHWILRAISNFALRCRWQIRSRKRTIEFVVRTGTIGLIAFVILGLVWTQQRKHLAM